VGEEKSFLRVVDGLFLVRETIESLRERQPNATESPAIPALPLEIKVPHWGNDDVELFIGPSDARIAISKALPQVIQQIQFIFHSWDGLTEIWAAVSCGIYFRFFKFERNRTPDVDLKEVLTGEYYQGENPYDIPVQVSNVIPFMDEGENYTDVFRTAWRKVMETVEKQFEVIIRAT